MSTRVIWGLGLMETGHLLPQPPRQPERRDIEPIISEYMFQTPLLLCAKVSPMATPNFKCQNYKRLECGWKRWALVMITTLIHCQIHTQTHTQMYVSYFFFFGLGRLLTFPTNLWSKFSVSNLGLFVDLFGWKFVKSRETKLDNDDRGII